MSQERASWTRGWKGTAVKLATAAVLLLLARSVPVVDTIALLAFLAVVVKPASGTRSQH